MPEEHDDICQYSYYLFIKGKENEPVIIGPRTLNLTEVVSKKFPKLNKEEIMANESIYLFNMMFNTNNDLLDAVIKRYNETHKNGLCYTIEETDEKGTVHKKRVPYTTNDFSYIAMLAHGNVTKNYGLLKYKYSKKENEEDRIKLVPFVFIDDINNLNKICADANIEFKSTDFARPSSLLVKLFDSFEKTNPNSKNKVFFNQLARKYKAILDSKYESVYGHASDKERYYSVADPEYDLESVRTALESRLMYTKYKLDSTLYFNILSMICHDIRLCAVANEYGTVYDPISRKMGYLDVTSGYQGLSAIGSIRDLRNPTGVFKKDTEENTRK